MNGTTAASLRNGVMKVFTDPTDPTKWPWKTGQELL
jgi:hypothetical protein